MVAGSIRGLNPVRYAAPKSLRERLMFEELDCNVSGTYPMKVNKQGL